MGHLVQLPCRSKAYCPDSPGTQASGVLCWHVRDRAVAIIWGLSVRQQRGKEEEGAMFMASQERTLSGQHRYGFKAVPSKR